MRPTRGIFVACCAAAANAMMVRARPTTSPIRRMRTSVGMAGGSLAELLGCEVSGDRRVVHTSPDGRMGGVDEAVGPGRPASPHPGEATRMEACRTTRSRGPFLDTQVTDRRAEPALNP